MSKSKDAPYPTTDFRKNYLELSDDSVKKFQKDFKKIFTNDRKKIFSTLDYDIFIIRYWPIGEMGALHSFLNYFKPLEKNISHMCCLIELKVELGDWYAEYILILRDSERRKLHEERKQQIINNISVKRTSEDIEAVRARVKAAHKQNILLKGV